MKYAPESRFNANGNSCSIVTVFWRLYWFFGFQELYDHFILTYLSWATKNLFLEHALLLRFILNRNIFLMTKGRDNVRSPFNLKILCSLNSNWSELVCRESTVNLEEEFLIHRKVFNVFYKTIRFFQNRSRITVMDSCYNWRVWFKERWVRTSPWNVLIDSQNLGKFFGMLSNKASSSSVGKSFSIKKQDCRESDSLYFWLGFFPKKKLKNFNRLARNCFECLSQYFFSILNIRQESWSTSKTERIWMESFLVLELLLVFSIKV